MKTLAWAFIFVVLAIAHGSLLWPLVRRRRMLLLPTPVEFAGLSAVMYFDIGILCECLGLRYRSPFFVPLFEHSEGNIVLSVLLIAIAPWLLRFGANCVRHDPPQTVGGRHLEPGKRKVAFYAMLWTAGTLCAMMPAAAVALSPRLWETRFFLGQLLGPWVIVLSLPMYLLAFYVQLEDSRTKAGKLVSAFLVVTSLLATVALGQRTLVLLPGAIVFLFAGRLSYKRVLVGAAAIVFTAAILLPIFKDKYQSRNQGAVELLSDTLDSDFYRAPELAYCVDRSCWFGSSTVAYSGEGYVYGALFFVPRAFAPFKGESTAQRFTADVMQSAPESLTWGFGISGISEVLLNFGIALTPCVLIAYGFVLGWLTKESVRLWALRVPLALGCLWLFGYHLPALLLNFGAMAIVDIVCERVFARPLVKAGGEIGS